MITRIFRVEVYEHLKDEFEIKFVDISVKVVNGYQGLISLEIGKPTQWAVDEYVMISKWEDEAALINFAGENWNEAHIPSGMEQFIKQCWVHHYFEFDSGIPASLKP